MTRDSTQPASPDTRYELIRTLGEGATGVVYLARDRESGEEVALKKLVRVDARSVARFKREFRSLADLHHPNLIKLYDLQNASDGWFLTMELLEGTDLRRGLILSHDIGNTLDGLQSIRATAPDPARVGGVAQAFAQLADGIRAIHRAGMLHRDLKPSNVMITTNGRIVVLDFGLVRGLDQPANDVTLEGNTIAGTPAYMPPEQVLGQNQTEASDWYAFGVMLYEALSGELPIPGGTVTELIRNKLGFDPPLLAPTVAPRPLADLCAALLRRDPTERPAADQISTVLTQLGSRPRALIQTAEYSFRRELGVPSSRAPLFGRDHELEQLEAAWAAASQNRSVVVHVRGPSGTGKSSLIEHFLDQTHASRDDYFGGPLVLRSRCYERESIPFKALDGVVDALANHLARLDDFEVARALPPEVGPLTQVFPVFERLQAVQRVLQEGGHARGDGARIRRRAELALRELVVNIARRRPVIAWIDDLQWGDLDSASVLRQWLQRPEETPVLLILSYRSEEIATSTCLRALLGDAETTPGSGIPRFELNLTPLLDADVEALCRDRLGANDPKTAGVVARIVRESQGNPFLALQLAALAHAKRERGDVDLEALSVEELVLRTSELLPEAARELLSVLAIAGRPLVPQLALNAARIERDGSSLVHALQGLRLVRARHVAGMRLIEVYHDRVREAVSASLNDGQRVRVHERLLRSLEASGRSDPGFMHELALGAGQRVLALRYGMVAAEIASASLAFEHAAELYERCLTLTEARAELGPLWSKLGTVLTRCRRGIKASEAFLKASEYVGEAERIPLMQLAASHLLRSGRFEEGEKLVRRVLEALRIEVPQTTAGMWAAIGWERARFALYAASYKPDDKASMPPDVFRRALLYGTFAIETQNHELLRAVLFQARAMRMAYQYGETTTIARAMCLNATMACVAGTDASAARAQVQLAEADQLCQRIGSQDIKSEVLSARALCALLVGRVAQAIEHATAAEEIYETRSSGGDQGDYYYLFAVRAVKIGALQNLGRHIPAAAELRESLALAHSTDNRAAVLQLTLAKTSVEQVLDRCATSRQRLDRERAELPRGGAGPLHILHMAAVLRAACMNREHAWGLGVVDDYWKSYTTSPLRRSAYFAYLLHVTRARLLLNRFVTEAQRGDPEAVVHGDLRWLSSKAPEPFRAPARSRILARIAHLRGDRAKAIEHFRSSADQHAKIGAQDEAAREQYALGYLLDDREDGNGALLRLAALNALRELGVIEPAQDLRGYYPELFHDAPPG